MAEYQYITTLGQDSHRFEEGIYENNTIKLGGVDIPSDRKYSANSDGDVMLHAITNAISGYTTVNILGPIADKLCLEQGIKDSTVYLKEALKYLTDAKIIHVSMSVECLRPKLFKHIPAIRSSVSQLLDIPESSVGITATTGEGLTGFGRGEGIQVLVIMTLQKEIK